jgi:outer membrane protein assembly factor BamA
MQRPPLLSLTLALLVSASLPAAAQKFLPKSIQFKGDPEYSDQELMAAAGLKKGVTLTSAEMNDHSKLLMDSGVFDTLTFKFDGQDLIYYLSPSTALFPIRLENLPLVPGKDLDAKLHDRFPLYHGKVPSEGTLLENVRGAFEEMLATEGIKATVTAIPAGLPGSRKLTIMSFSVTDPQVRVGVIHVNGASSDLQPRIKTIADQTVHTPFDTENSAANLEHAFGLFYADQGYAAAKVQATRDGDPVVTPQAIDIPFMVTIDEGRIYKLGAIHLPPDSLVTQAEIDKTVQQHNDSRVQGVTLRTIWSFIASRYKSKGYLDCIVTPHPELDDAASTVNYTVAIHPGPVYHLAFVKFDNVSDDLRSRLMRIWQMLPGDPFDETYVSSFVVNAQKNDPVLMRTLSGVKVTFDVHADPDSHDVNCVIHFAKLQQAP